MTTIQAGLLGMLAGAIFVLIRDLVVSYIGAHREKFLFKIFNLGLYIAYSIMGGVIGMGVHFLWSL